MSGRSGRRWTLVALALAALVVGVARSDGKSKPRPRSANRFGIAEADADGKSVTIHVERMNPALRLYERLGFSVAEDKGVYLFLERPPAT